MFQLALSQNESHADWQSRYVAAAVYMGVGKYSRARRELRIAAKDKPHMPYLMDALRSTAYFSGRYREAVALEWALLLLAPQLAIARPVRLFETLAHTGVVAALAYCAIFHIKTPQPYSQLGLMAYQKRHYVMSAVLYHKAYAESGKVDWLSNAAAALSLAGRWRAAIRVWDKVLRIDPTHHAARVNRQTVVSRGRNRVSRH